MKNKSIILIFIIATVLLFIYSAYIKGWMAFRKKTDTPERFLNHVTAQLEKYSKDSLLVLWQLKKSMVAHESFLDNTLYDDSTELLIDTILYSENLNKLAVFLLTKNSVSRQIVPDNHYKYYYDATCYLGVREADTIQLNWIGPVFTNSYQKQVISDDIRAACFRTFATSDNSDVYEYNLNDVRFWSSAIWKKVADERLNDKIFEAEKLKHPDNIYEPKRR